MVGIGGIAVCACVGFCVSIGRLVGRSINPFLPPLQTKNRHSAYRDLDGEERKRLFDEHITSLEAKLQKKVRCAALCKYMLSRVGGSASVPWSP